MKSVLCFALLLLSAAAAFGQTGLKITPRDPSALIEPKAAVRRYCQMDAEGFRLNSDTEKRLFATTTWKERPEWHGFDVIQSFDVVSAKWNARGVLVRVQYRVLGHFENGVGYGAAPHVDTVDVQVIEDKDDWKVEGSDDLVRPRVSRTRTTKWLRDEIATAKDAETKQLLEKTLRQLQ